MSEPAESRMSVEEFLEWGLRQELRYELVHGVPIAMTGARQRHDRIVMNAQAALHPQLRGSGCRNFSADIAVRVPNGNIRRPDLGIDCGAFDEAATTAGAPFLLLDVLSPSTRETDMIRKLEEYKSIPALAHIVFVDNEQREVLHWSRATGGEWRYQVFESADDPVTFPEIGCVLTLRDLYDGLTFRSLPRLVRDDTQPA